MALKVGAPMALAAGENAAHRNNSQRGVIMTQINPDPHAAGETASPLQAAHWTKGPDNVTSVSTCVVWGTSPRRRR
jgi:hypothetical protein